MTIYICEWQQTNERIVGRDNFIAIHSAYPAEGSWTFVINRIIVDNDREQVVTEVDVSDGRVNARAITFHTVKNRKITKQLEYWLDDFRVGMDKGHLWREQWVEPITID